MKIWNTINIPKDQLITDYKSGCTLGELAAKHGCSNVTVKRKLRSFGVDTSLHNGSEVAKRRHREAVSCPLLTKDYLTAKYLNENLDSKTIAEELGIHYSTVRKYLRIYELRKSSDQLVGAWQSRYKAKHGVIHPSQHRDLYARSLNRVQYYSAQGQEFKFKSILELTFALLLDKNEIDWDYEAERVPYLNHITGKQRYYCVDFVTAEEWIEVKPDEKMIPNDKRLYAEASARRQSKLFRGCTAEERHYGWWLLVSGFRHEHYDFIRYSPKTKAKQISYYFKTLKELTDFKLPVGFKYHFRKCLAPWIFKLVLRRLS